MLNNVRLSTWLSKAAFNQEIVLRYDDVFLEIGQAGARSDSHDACTFVRFTRFRSMIRCV